MEAFRLSASIPRPKTKTPLRRGFFVRLMPQEPLAHTWVFSSAEPSGLRGRREGSRPRPLLPTKVARAGFLAWQKSEIELFVMAITSLEAVVRHPAFPMLNTA